MFRKTILAIAATAAIGAAAFTPTAASAQWGGWHGHRGYYHGGPSFNIRLGGPVYAAPYAYGPRCYTVRRVVRTQWGPRARLVRVCR
jgi:hypothetical protein